VGSRITTRTNDWPSMVLEMISIFENVSSSPVHVRYCLRSPQSTVIVVIRCPTECRQPHGTHGSAVLLPLLGVFSPNVHIPQRYEDELDSVLFPVKGGIAV
jgi:hypothetical protein